MNRKKRRTPARRPARSAHETKQITDVDELRAAEISAERELMRAAFLSNNLGHSLSKSSSVAALFDDWLCAYASATHARALQAVTGMLDRELRQQSEVKKK
jgi:hypothetical protein